MAELRSRHPQSSALPTHPSSAHKEREHLQHLVDSGPLHGVFLVVGPLFRAAMVIYFLKIVMHGSYDTQHTAPMLWRIVPMVLATVLSGALGSTLSAGGELGKAGILRGPGQADMVIHAIELGVKIVILVLWWWYDLVPELALITTSAAPATNPLPLILLPSPLHGLIFAVVGGVGCAALHILLPKWLFYDKVLHNREARMLLKQQLPEWNPAATFPGVGSGSAFARPFMHIVRILSMTIVSPIEDGIVFFSVFYRGLCAGAFPLFDTVSFSHFSSIPFMACVFIYAAQFLRVKYGWVAGFVLGVVCLGLMIATGGLQAALAAYVVRSVCIVVWVEGKKEWGLW